MAVYHSDTLLQVTLVPDLNADGAETISAAILEKRNSLTKASPVTGTSQSTTENAQLNPAIAVKRRPRPSSTTGPQEELDKGDSKPKK